MIFKGGVFPSIVKVPGDVLRERVLLFQSSNPVKGILFCGQAKGIIFDSIGLGNGLSKCKFLPNTPFCS